MKFSIKDGNYAVGFDVFDGGTNFEGTLAEAIAEAENSKSLEQKCKQACEMIEDSYQTYCKQGLLYQTYIINNNEITRDEIDKKLANVILDIDTSYDWTMDNPREKVASTSKETCIDFMKAVQCVIASNETKLRDKKTEIDNMDEAGVNAYISSPTYPTYERTV